MEPIRLNDIIKACSGKHCSDKSLKDEYIDNITIDSRKTAGKSLYIPIKGEVHDGHKFIGDAFKNGCLYTLSEKKLIDHDYILVESTMTALKEIAEYYRGLFDARIIAITGSVGKTTAKEMIASVLSQKYSVLKNQENQNNEFGLPLTLLNLNKKIDIAVVELGMNSFGEISRLSKTARPDICIIMNIGDSHIGNLGSREGIFKAKCEIFDYMKEDASVFLFGDDSMLLTLNDRIDSPVFFGTNENNDIRLKRIVKADIRETVIIADVYGDDIEIIIPVPGRYMIPSVLCAIALGKEFGLSDSQIKDGVAAYIPVKMRKDIIESGNITIIDDSYNASKDSILSGLEILELAAGRKVAILGDILEVGEHGESIHSAVGKEIAKMNVDVFICCGEMSKFIHENILKHSDKTSIYYKDKEMMHNSLKELIKDGDTVFVKASRGCRFDRTVEFLREI